MQRYDFVSKPEAYTNAIIFVRKLKDKHKEFKQIAVCIENIKIAFENHEQNPEIICSYLENITKLPLADEDQVELESLIQTIRKSKYKQSDQKKFENSLARRAESELYVLLLLSPTKAMMEAVKNISSEILKAIEIIEKSDKNILENFLRSLTETYGPMAAGSFKKTPTLEHIKQILTANDPKQFIEIMNIHHKYGLYVMRLAPVITVPKRAPVGKFAELVKEKGGYENFLKLIGSEKDEGARSFISDEKFYYCDLYRRERNKGRAGELRSTRYQQLGLMLASQDQESKDLPYHSSYWCPDCKCQDPDFKSFYVRDLIENDCVYVSGPSGMASLLLGLMETYGNLPEVILKQHYLLAVLVFIGGCGYHCGHEVLGPAEYVLGLVPGYKVQTPQPDVLASPPNYHLFYQQQDKIDPEFAEKRQQAWEKYLIFYENIYLKLDRRESKGIEQKKDASEIPIDKDLHKKIKNATEAHFIDWMASKRKRSKKWQKTMSQLQKELLNVIDEPILNKHQEMISIIDKYRERSYRLQKDILPDLNKLKQIIIDDRDQFLKVQKAGKTRR